MANQREVPPNLLKGPWLRWADDGTVTFRWRPAILLFALTVVQCVLMAWIARRTDHWLGVPMILGAATGLLIWTAVQGRRHLRVARSPGGRFRLPLTDWFLLMAAAAAVAAGYSINDRQRSVELARRQALKAQALELIGPNGAFDRDHRAQIWLTIGDPTFDDARLAELLKRLAYDQQRYGITRLIFSAGPWITNPSLSPTGQPLYWPRLTGGSVDRLSKLTSLTDLQLSGTAVGASHAARLLALPNLNVLGLTEVVPVKIADPVLKANPRLMLHDGPAPWRRRDTATATQPKPPPQPTVASPPAPNPGSPPGSRGSGAARSSPSLPSP